MKIFNARFGAWALSLSLLGSPFAPVLPAQTFTDVTATVTPGLPGATGASVAWGDYDNDGRLDFLLTGGGLSQVWRNTDSGFTDVTATVAPGLPGVAGGSAAWGDYDNDGRLDFLLTGWGIAQLWRNTGNGFTDVTAAVAPGLPHVVGSTVAWADYDNDGRLDFFIGGEDVSQLWRNTGSGFTNVTATVAPGLRGIYAGSVAWGDYDNDGLLDFLLTGGAPGPDSNYTPTSQVWRNTGSGFVNVTASVAPGLPQVYHSCVAWGDYDNDGRLDFLLGGRSSGATPVCQLWRNTGNGFMNVTALAPGLPGLDSGSVSWADYDNDGNLDFLLTAGITQLRRNTGSGFTDVTATIAPGLSGVSQSSVGWADYDNDGRVDFLLGGSVSQLWRNNTPQSNPPPVAITELPDSVSPISVTLNGRINPRGHAANAWFIWGTSTNYGNVTAPQPMGNGNSLSNFSQAITGLSAGVTYYYRAVGSNDLGQVFLGIEERFWFAAPAVGTSPAKNLSTNSATLNATVYPNNLSVYGWFEWGTTLAYGQVTPVQSLGHGFYTSFSENLFGLEPGSTYYFRAVASNGLGVAYGAAQSLATSSTNIVCGGYFSPPSRIHGYGGGSGSIYFWVGCEWTLMNTSSWITITSPTNGAAGPGGFNYIVAPNPDPEPRSGNIVVGGRIFPMGQSAKDPVIDTQPIDQSALAGDTVTFHVAARGTPPLTYQWQFNNVPLVDGDGISGATTPDLVLSNVRESQAGRYRVWVTSARGANDSSAARLSVSCGFNLSASNASFDSLSATGSVTLNTVSTTCAWSLANTNPWVVVLSSVTNHGNATVVFALAPNPTASSRSGNITIADQTFTITQAGDGPNTAMSLPEALDTEGILTWDTIGTPSWFGQTLISHDGVDAAQNGPISHDTAVTAWTVISGPGTLSFWWKVSSETNKDFLKFFVDGVQQTRISGEVDWEWRSYTFPSGTYTSKWTYSKNENVSLGNDRGWFDQVAFVSGPSCAATLSHTNATHSSDAETGQVSVTAAEGCTWNVITLTPWITNLVDAGQGNGFVRYTLATNSLPWSRTGVVVIAGQPFTIVQQGAPLSCAYEISPTTRTFDYHSAIGVFSVTAHEACEWIVVNTNDFVTILSPTTNSGSGQVVYSVSENTTSLPHNGYIRIDNQAFFVCQYGRPPCTYSLAPYSRSHGYGVATGAVSVITQEGCTWSAFTTNSWITIVSGTSGSGNGVVSYSIADNPAAFTRTGKIQIGNQTYTIFQSAGPGITLAEALDIVGTPLSVWNAGSWAGQISVTHDGVDAASSDAGSFTLTANGPGTLTFWWKISSQTNSSLRLYFGGSEQARITGQVDWEQRTFTLPAGTQNLEWGYARNYAGPPPDRGWVDQVQFVPTPLCPVTLSPGNASHPSSSSTGAVSVAAASDCAWYVFNTNSWILITSATNGTGNGTVSYVLATNPTTSARSGNIQIADQIFPITQLAGATNPPPNCTIAISPTNRIHGYANASNLVFVTTQNGCAWNVVNTNPWVSIHSSLNNVGSGTVNYSLALNANADARSGNVIIGGQLFRLTQQGAGTNAPRLQIMARTGTNAMLSVQGEAGKMYIVEGSEDLIHWTPISTNSAPSTVTDATVGNAPRRFYRTVESP